MRVVPGCTEGIMRVFLGSGSPGGGAMSIAVRENSVAPKAPKTASTQEGNFQWRVSGGRDGCNLRADSERG